MIETQKYLKKQIPGVIFLVAMAAFTGSSIYSMAITGSRVKDSIEKIVNAEAKYGLFSGAILVAEKGEVIYSGAIGLADKADNIPNEMTTKFNLGSIGITFTGGNSNIPVATKYDYNFRKGRSLGEIRKQYKEAVKYLDKNIQGDEPHLPSLFLAARVLISGNFELEQALKLLDRYLRITKERSNRTEAAVWWLKGQAHENIGNREKAIKCYEASLRSDPEFGRAEDSLKKLRSKKLNA